LNVTGINKSEVRIEDFVWSARVTIAQDTRRQSMSPICEFTVSVTENRPPFE